MLRNSLPTTPNSIPSFIKIAKSLGFVDVGFSRPERPLFFDQFCAWVAAGKHGGMNWLGRHLDLRENPGKLLDGCQTVITLAYAYSSNKPSTPDSFTAARYTEPNKEDYHLRLRKQAKMLARSIVDWHPGARIKVCVDSAPIVERSFAYVSGIGFIGKNNMLITPAYGSYIYLVEILTTAFLSYPKTDPKETQCGSCTRCLDACPTGALERPFCLDASKCLSYLTVEHREAVDSGTGKKMGNCFFGCDVCQEVCPFNREKSPSDFSLPSTDEILAMGAEEFEEKFGKTAFARSGLDKLKSNIRAVRSKAC
jgi:epoxyqueuosine reductase